MRDKLGDFVVIALSFFILFVISVSFSAVAMALPAAAILGILSILGLVPFTLINYLGVLAIGQILFLFSR